MWKIERSRHTVTVHRCPFTEKGVFVLFTDNGGRITENTFIEEKFFTFLRDKITVNGYDMIKLNFAKGNGLLPAIAQDYKTGEVLMLAYMNEEAWQKTLETGKVHYFSRTRQELWLKGKSSGHVQAVKEIYVDCDEDTILVKVDQLGGAACHTGYRSCFYRKVEDNELKIAGEKVFDPKEVYKS